MAKANDSAAKLKKYRAMRDFNKTQEPAGNDAPSNVKGLRYLIQKHAATRLHYDFRLEWEGVLWSWAVTRGPSLDPDDKRLAVHTEDHPIEYAGFEGTIPAGEYGGGTVMLWDTGTWEPLPQKGSDIGNDYAKGKIHFRLHGERLQGEWILLRMRGRAAREKRENWLLIKAEDEFAKAGDGDWAVQNYERSVLTERDLLQIANSNSEWKKGKIRQKSVSGAVKKTKIEDKTKLSPSSKSTNQNAIAAPDNFSLQLATLVDEPPKGKEWIHEIKFDGYRLLVCIHQNHVTMLTRNGHDWTHKFSELAERFAALDLNDALIDGEVVVAQSDGTMKFSDLQNALTENDQSQMQFYAFDLLYAEGKNVSRLNLIERKTKLQTLIDTKDPFIHYSEHFSEDGANVLHNACRIALEGIISKRADKPYRPGRSGDWLKSKCIHEQEFVIGGYTLPSNGSNGIGALLLGFYEEGKFTYAGRVGTGFDHAMSKNLKTRLGHIERPTMPFMIYSDNGRRGAGWKKNVIWVEPNLVCQVTFTEWTEEGMLRHPSFQGMREDKAPSQVIREREKPVENAVRHTAKSSHAATGMRTPTRKSNAPRQMGGVTLTHPERVLYADAQVTKQMLADYYLAVAPLMLPHVAGRPLSLTRCPEGTAAKCFFQRHASPGMPDAIHIVDIDKGSDEENYIMLEDTEGLVASVQMGALELHVWGAEANDVERPDRIVFDFDPGPKVLWEAVKEAVEDMRARLQKLGLESFLKTTGGKGLHVVVPFNKGPGWPKVKEFAHAMCAIISEEDSAHFTVNMRKKGRDAKIFLDYLRNERSATAIAPYSARARAGAPVAMPVAWKDLETLTSGAQFTVKNALHYLEKRRTDPWADLGTIVQKLPV